MKPDASSRKVTQARELLTLAFSLLVVLLIAAFSYATWIGLRQSSEQLEISRRMVQAATHLLSTMKDAETGQRGFLLTSRESYLQPYQQSLSEIPKALSELTAAAKRPDQAARVKALTPLVEQKQEELQRTIALYQSQNRAAALAIVASGQGKAIMDEIRMRCAEIEAVDYSRQALYAGEAQSRTYRLGLISTLGSACLFVFLAFATVTIRNGTKARHELIGRTRTDRDWFQTTLASIGDAVISADPAGCVTFMNAVAQSLTGWKEHEAVGTPLEHIFVITNEGSGKPVENPVSKAIREGRVVGLANHTILTAKDGTRTPIDDSAAPIFGVGGELSGVVLVFRDITDRKKTEEQLRRSVEFHQAVLMNMGEGLYTVDAQGLVTSMNPAAEKLLDWSFEELRGRKMHDMIHHHHPDGTPFPVEECSGFQVLAQGHNLVDHEDVFIRKDGSFFNVIYSSSPLRSGNEILGLVVAFRDVSERTRLEQALQNSERIYRGIGESIQYGVWVCAADGRNTYASESFLQLVGLTQQQCSDFGWGSVLHPDDKESTIAAWKDCVGAEGTWNIERRFRGTDGRYHWILVRGIALRDESGKVTGWAGINLDIDQLKAAEESLQASEQELRASNRALLRANEDLQQFAYSASHDLQEPIRNVTVYSEIIASRYNNILDEDGRLYLGFLSESGRRLATLISDLLAYTRVGTIEGRFEKVDAGEVFKRTLFSLEQAIRENEATVTCDPLPKVGMMETHLQQLFQNLIGNALKYRREETPRIHVSATRHDDVWRFAVSDNGVGIAPQHKETIFGVFKRLHNDKKYSGTGIGLAICQRVVARYGGRIWVESEPGKGATFFFTVPQAADTENPAIESAAT